MSYVLKISAAAIASTLCVLLIRSKNPEYAYSLLALTAAAIFASSLTFLPKLIDFINEAVAESPLSPALFMPVIKCVGIAITVKTASELCRDAWQSAAASALEYFGTAAALAVSLPVLSELLVMLEALL